LWRNVNYWDTPYVVVDLLERFLPYLANLRNSTVIEMYNDKFRISYSFWECQLLKFIAGTCTSPLKSGNDDITTFLRPLKVHRCWRYHRVHSRFHHPNILYSHTNRKARILAVNLRIPYFLILSLSCYSLFFFV
jgi:hypothetical protein